ncbi:MAG: hypothetical protein CBB97_19580 [Candidatus Endolissoclinum sp. TMED37]|nr:MAG: hypothetical protein CBB97_19580 [Candidatus Endolissoclinum sp. TMED37]|tara:strand:- start:153 stop:1373 length:1221 start_codon:yes stop_codon:yes gene_type:complete
MNVLHLGMSDQGGGAANATRRFVAASRERGIDAELHVINRTSGCDFVSSSVGKLTKLYALNKPFLERVYFKRTAENLGSPYTSTCLKYPMDLGWINSNFDIVHMHWIASAFDFGTLSKIKVPIVWTLCDEWAYTGGCHYAFDCEGYKTGCKNCPMIRSWTDVSSRQLVRKAMLPQSRSMAFVGKSRWVSERCKQSIVGRSAEVHTIPNGLDLNLFGRHNKADARRALGLDAAKKYALFGAVNAKSSLRKGYAQMKDILNKMRGRIDDLGLVIFGAEEVDSSEFPGYDVTTLGVLRDDLSLSMAYAAVDVTLFPSLQENLSNVILESIACGTPVVAYNVGGNPDLIVNDITGRIVDECDNLGFAEAICDVLVGSAIDSIACRDFAVKNFNYDRIVGMYQAVYQGLMA